MFSQEVFGRLTAQVDQKALLASQADSYFDRLYKISGIVANWKKVDPAFSEKIAKNFRAVTEILTAELSDTIEAYTRVNGEL
jgi:hypothetical protein